MSIINRLSVSLKISADGTRTNLVEVGGLTKIGFHLKNDCLENESLRQNKWRHLLHGSGATGMEVEIDGHFTDQYSEHLIRLCAFENKMIFAQILFENNDNLCGDFFITDYQRYGDAENERYHMLMISSGEVRYMSESSNNLVAIDMV